MTLWELRGARERLRASTEPCALLTPGRGTERGKCDASTIGLATRPKVRPLGPPQQHVFQAIGTERFRSRLRALTPLLRTAELLPACCAGSDRSTSPAGAPAAGLVQ